VETQFDGKVAFITGAARGQGRSHAVRFAEEGADIIAFDLCDQIDSVAYPMATREDLDETVNLVEKAGRRIVAEQGDVRDFDRLKSAVANGVAELGRVDFVLANAGIMPGVGEQRYEIAAYVDAVNILLNGVYYTVEAALPALLEHGDGGGDRHYELSRRIQELVLRIQRSKSRLRRLSRRQTRRRWTYAVLRDCVGREEHSRQYRASIRGRYADDYE
jgi:NAD(P)-dependent dehydrogenase (short-subunit alcohol dehydrogenase family)